MTDGLGVERFMVNSVNAHHIGNRRPIQEFLLEIFLQPAKTVLTVHVLGWLKENSRIL